MPYPHPPRFIVRDEGRIFLKKHNIEDSDNVGKRQLQDNAVNENGRVVAYVLLLSMASVIICSLWAIIHIIPLLIIPALFLYSKNFMPLDILRSKWSSILEIGNGQRKGVLEEEPADNSNMLAKLAYLENENKRLLAELEKRKQITEELWKQLEEYTSRSSPTEASIEKRIEEKTIQE